MTISKEALLMEQTKSGTDSWKLSTEVKEYLKELKDYLTPWDTNFLEQVYQYGARTAKQKATIHVIVEKAEQRKVDGSKVYILSKKDIKALDKNKELFSEWEKSFYDNLVSYEYTISSDKQRAIVDKLIAKKATADA